MHYTIVPRDLQQQQLILFPLNFNLLHIYCFIMPFINADLNHTHICTLTKYTHLRKTKAKTL